MIPLLCVVSMTVAAPMADAWPYAVRSLADGGVEYRFDLTPIKNGGATADALDAFGEQRVKAFLAGLPREVRVRVGWAPLDIAMGRSGESRPLAISYGSVSDGPIALADPLGRLPGARLRPALHPEEPKLLLSAEAVAHLVRSVEDAALAAEELDTEKLRRALWAKVTRESIRRARQAQGDAREGALVLAARVLAASACLKPKWLDEAARGVPDVAQAARAELEIMAGDATLRPTFAPWTSLGELSCGWIRDRALATPFASSRVGVSAVLTYLSVVDSDPKLKALEATLRRRRARFLGAPLAEPLDVWRAHVKGEVGQLIDGLDDFITQEPLSSRPPTGLLALPSTPFGALEGALGVPERVDVWEELEAAVHDGRVKPSGAMWPSAREAALVPFAAPDLVDLLVLDSGWRGVLKASFVTLLGGATAPRGGVVEPAVETGVRRELVVRLQVPPALEVEPLASLYGRLAQSLEALRAALVAEGLGGLRPVYPEGRGALPVLEEAAGLVSVLRGLEALAAGKEGEGAELVLARRFLSTWRRAPALRRDVRRASAATQLVGDERQHAVIVGVARRELTVGFTKPPEIDLVGGAEQLEQLFEIDTTARQKYLTPLLVAVPVVAPSFTGPLDQAVVRALVDSVGRDSARAELAVVKALHSVEHGR